MGCVCVSEIGEKSNKGSIVRQETVDSKAASEKNYKSKSTRRQSRGGSQKTNPSKSSHKNKLSSDSVIPEEEERILSIRDNRNLLTCMGTLRVKFLDVDKYISMVDRIEEERERE